MSRNKVLKIVNVVLLILVISQVATGYFGAKLSFEAFKWGHKRAVLVLLAFAALHLVLNWNWVKANFFKRK